MPTPQLCRCAALTVLIGVMAPLFFVAWLVLASA
jgi:hypothetical protein